MAKVQPVRAIIIARIKKSPRARKAVAQFAEIHGERIDPENWKALLAFIEKLFEQLLPLILRLI